MATGATTAALATAATTITVTSGITATTIASTAAAMTTMTGNRLLLTAHQGDTDDREENRDPENQSAIHLSESSNTTGT